MKTKEPTDFHSLPSHPFKGPESWQNGKAPESVGLQMVPKPAQSLLHQLLHSPEIRPSLVLCGWWGDPQQLSHFNSRNSWGVHRCWGDKKGINFLSGNYNTMLLTLDATCVVNIGTVETREKSNANSSPEGWHRISRVSPQPERQGKQEQNCCGSILLYTVWIYVAIIGLINNLTGQYLNMMKSGRKS